MVHLAFLVEFWIKCLNWNLKSFLLTAGNDIVDLLTLAKMVLGKKKRKRAVELVQLVQHTVQML